MSDSSFGYFNQVDLEAVRRHLGQPQVPVEQHARERHAARTGEALSKHRIYLDQKWWIHCRDALGGRAVKVKKEQLRIAELLASLVDSGRVICPVAFSILQETAKQGDLAVRSSTARTIDRLSQGVVLRSPVERVRLEFSHLWFLENHGEHHGCPPIQFVWTFPGFIIREIFPDSSKLPIEIQGTAQKVVYDSLADTSFTQAVQLMAGMEASTYPKIEEMADDFNKGRARDQCEKKSFGRIYAEEVGAMLDAMLAKGMIDTQRFAELCPEQFSTTESDVRDFVVKVREMCRSRQWTTQFPSVHIFASIHAMSRRADSQNEANDLWDCDHACAALPYCNAFLTEKRVGSTITQKPISLDTAYSCKVLWKESDILAFLETLP